MPAGAERLVPGVFARVLPRLWWAQARAPPERTTRCQSTRRTQTDGPSRGVMPERRRSTRSVGHLDSYRHRGLAGWTSHVSERWAHKSCKLPAGLMQTTRGLHAGGSQALKLLALFRLRLRLRVRAAAAAGSRHVATAAAGAEGRPEPSRAGVGVARVFPGSPCGRATRIRACGRIGTCALGDEAPTVGVLAPP